MTCLSFVCFLVRPSSGIKFYLSMSLQLGRAFIIFFCLTENLCIVEEYRRQAEHDCLCVGGKGLELPALSVLGPSCAGVPFGFAFSGACGGGWQSCFFSRSVFENGRIALGPYKHLFKLLLLYSW